jgi:hypothetical protein
MDRREIEEKLLDFIYQELPPKEMKLMEKEIQNYPDLLEESKKLKESLEILQYMKWSEPSSSLMDKVNIEADRMLRERKNRELKKDKKEFSLAVLIKSVLMHPAFSGGIVAVVILVIFISVFEKKLEDSRTEKLTQIEGEQNIPRVPQAKTEGKEQEYPAGRDEQASGQKAPEQMTLKKETPADLAERKESVLKKPSAGAGPPAKKQDQGEIILQGKAKSESSATRAGGKSAHQAEGFYQKTFGDETQFAQPPPSAPMASKPAPEKEEKALATGGLSGEDKNIEQTPKKSSLIQMEMIPAEHEYRFEEKKAKKSMETTTGAAEPPENPEILLSKARELKKNGELDKALKIYMELLKKFPSFKARKTVISEAMGIASTLKKNALLDELSEMDGKKAAPAMDEIEKSK